MRTLRWKEARVRTGGVEDAIVVERAESALVVRSAVTAAAAVGFAAALPREFRSPKPRTLSRLPGRASAATVTAIPAGLWVRLAGNPPMPLVDLGFGVPVEPARPVVLVGAPGEQPPGVGELAACYEALPPAVRDLAVLVPYGQDPGACAALAQSLADRLDGMVRAYHALPHYATDGRRKFAVFNTNGEADRLTETPENAYAPSRALPRQRQAWPPIGETAPGGPDSEAGGRSWVGSGSEAGG